MAPVSKVKRYLCPTCHISFPKEEELSVHCQTCATAQPPPKRPRLSCVPPQVEIPTPPVLDIQRDAVPVLWRPWSHPNESNVFIQPQITPVVHDHAIAESQSQRPPDPNLNEDVQMPRPSSRLQNGSNLEDIQMPEPSTRVQDGGNLEDIQIPGPSSRVQDGGNRAETEALRRALNFIRDKTCPFCDLQFNTPAQVTDHLDIHHQDFFQVNQEGGGEGPIEVIPFISVHAGTTVEYRATLNNPFPNNLLQFFKNVRQPLHDAIKFELEKRKNIKIFINMTAEFSHPNDDMRIKGNFTSFCFSILRPGQIQKILKLAFAKIEKDVEEYTCERSGWVLEGIEKFATVITTYRPLFGSSYMELPPPLNEKKCLLNINNSEVTLDGSEKKCFLWSVLAHSKLGGEQFENVRHRNAYRKNKKPESYYAYKDKINDEGINYPMDVDQIKKFEKLNPTIGITVIGYEDQGKFFTKEKDENKRKYKIVKNNTFLLYACQEDRPIQIDLLLLIKGDKYHYVLIKNLSALLSLCDKKYKRLICRNCLQGFKSERTLNEHIKYCAARGLQTTKFPDKEFLKFESFHRTQKLGFRFYADFESLLPESPPTDKPSHPIANHMPCGYAWTCVDFKGKKRMSKCYRAASMDEDVSALLVKDIMEYSALLEKEIDELQAQADKNMKITKFEEMAARKKGDCCFCKRPLSEDVKGKPQQIVRHHNHFPPHRFIGLAHNYCNLQGSLRKDFPVFIHNGGNYDFHFLVKSLSKLEQDEVIGGVEVIPKSSEKYLAILVKPPGAPKDGGEEEEEKEEVKQSYRKIRFVDSLAFTLASLDNLVKSMPKDAFKIVREEFANSGGDVNLLFEKGAYPYSYMKSYENFNETTLPPRECFRSDLSEEDLSQETYEHAKKVWESFGIKNMGEWHDLYVRLDTALLADVMEASREILYNKYDLELAHYFSVPMLAWDAALKVSNVSLEYIRDSTMHCWIEEGIRGGFCGPGSVRAAKANNKYMGEHYDPNEESSYLLYMDANNLYGWAMSQALPTHGFKWIEDEELPEDVIGFLEGLGDDDEDGYFFEVDLEVPEELHEKFNDYPPAPTRRSVNEEELSEAYQKPLMEDLDIKKSALKTQKLICDLLPKKNYICHYRALKQYVKYGYKISKVHKVLTFKQSKWMKIYIDANTQMRNMSMNEFEKAFWKLMNNSAFGKTIEQKRNRQNVRIVLSAKKSQEFSKKPTVQSIICIDEGLSIFVMKKLVVTLDKPIYVGVAILDLAKCLMYEMHYEVMQPFYGERAKLVYTDTDSLIYHLETEDMYKDMQANSGYFDMSEYDRNHPQFGEFYSDQNKKVLGKMKDECHNKVIRRIAAVRPKMYAYETLELEEDGKMVFSESKRAKGLGRTAVKNRMNLEQYVKVMEAANQTYAEFKKISSKKHSVVTEHLHKKALNAFCNKRYCLDSVRSLAYGHKDTKEYVDRHNIVSNDL